MLLYFQFFRAYIYITFKNIVDNKNKTKEFVYVPLIAGPIAIAYRIDGYKGKIQLKKETLAKIFAGDITKWNDPQIVKDNTIKKVKKNHSLKLNV